MTTDIDTARLRVLADEMNSLADLQPWCPDGSPEWSALKGGRKAILSLLDTIDRQAATIESLRAERDQTRKTAQFWKDQHLAGNALIEGLEQQLREAEARAVPSDPARALRGWAGTFITKKSISDADRRHLSRLCEEFDAITPAQPVEDMQ